MPPLTEEQRQLVADNIDLAYWFASRYLELRPNLKHHAEDFKAVALLTMTEAVAAGYDPEVSKLGTWLGLPMRGRFREYERHLRRQRTFACPFGNFDMNEAEELLQSLVGVDTGQVPRKDLANHLLSHLDGMTFKECARKRGKTYHQWAENRIRMAVRRMAKVAKEMGLEDY
jgi:hypothetical protein